MDLSKQDDVFVKDLLQPSWKKATPEELVRQQLLQDMVSLYGYPKEMLAVEKTLLDMPHLQGEKKIPHRRIDIVCFAKNIHPVHLFYPLLLIECKREGKLKGALDQILGYNHYVGAYCVAVATTDAFLMQFSTKKGALQKHLSHPPFYHELLAAILP